MSGHPAPDVASPAPATWRTWVILGLILLVVAGVRLRFASVPLERDEGEYAVFGRLILQGQVPYVAAYNMKLPGVYYAYALILAVFGEWDVGIRLGTLVVTLISTGLVCFMACKMAGDRAGLSAALAFGLFSSHSTTLGFTANAEHFVVVFVLAGFWVLTSGPSASRVFLAGVLLGLSVLMKQHAALFGAFAMGWVALAPGHTRSLRIRRTLSVLAGMAVPYLMTVLYFAFEGAFEQFWFWTVTYAREYTGTIAWQHGLKLLRHETEPILARQFPILVPAVVGLATLGRVAAPWRAWLWVLLGVSFLSTCPGLLFRHHYFLLMAPAIAFLAGLGTEALLQRVTPGRRPLATAAILFAMGLGELALEGPMLLASAPEVSRRSYGTNAFPESREIARHLQGLTLPEEPIAVIGSEPQIYFYARRAAATGYIYTYAMMEDHSYARKMQQQMIREIETLNPRFFVFVKTPHSWLIRPESDMELNGWIQNSLLPRCDIVGVVEIITSDGFHYTTRETWGPDAARQPPRSPLYFLVLKRIGS